MVDRSLTVNREQLLGNSQEYAQEFEQPSEYDELKKNTNLEMECYQSMNICCGSVSGCLRAWLPCVCCILDKPFVEVPQSSKAILERFGKPIEVLNPGLHQINTCVDQVRQISFKTRILELPKQQITTKDNVTLFVDTVIYYRVLGILRAVYKIENLSLALLGKQIKQHNRNQSVASIRSVLGEMTLNEILSNKEELASRLEFTINDMSKKWGTLVEDVFFKDISLNAQTQDDMASMAKQRRLGESKLISNKAEVQAAILLKQTAEILDSKAAMQVRYLEVIQNITKNCPDQVIFLPLDPQAQGQKPKQ